MNLNNGQRKGNTQALIKNFLKKWLDQRKRILVFLISLNKCNKKFLAIFADICKHMNSLIPIRNNVNIGKHNANFVNLHFQSH